MDSGSDPDPLTFVQDRITVLRAAHALVKEWDMTFDVADLLDVAGWLAGDDLPLPDDDAPARPLVAPDSDQDGEDG